MILEQIAKNRCKSEHHGGFATTFFSGVALEKVYAPFLFREINLTNPGIIILSTPDKETEKRFVYCCHIYYICDNNLNLIK